MQTPPSLLPHDFCSPGRSNKWWHTTKPQEGCLSHSQSFAKKSMWRKQTHVSEASAASRSSASCSTWVAAWSFLHMTLFIFVHCCFLSSMFKPGRRIVRLCIRGRGEEEEFNPALFVETLWWKESNLWRQILRLCITQLTYVYLSFIPVGLTVILAVWSSPYFQFECNRHTI